MTAQPLPPPVDPQRVDPAAVPASRGARLANPANALTLLRLVLVPVFLGVLLHAEGSRPGWRVAAWAVFALATLTDRVDGAVARGFGLVTDFGKVADPIADKALTGSALVALSLLGELPWAVTVVIVTREVGITALRFWVLRHGVIAASRGGKLKTALQGLAVSLYLLPLTGWLGATRAVLMAVAVAVTVLTGFDYVARALALRRAARRAAPV